MTQCPFWCSSNVSRMNINYINTDNCTINTSKLLNTINASGVVLVCDHLDFSCLHSPASSKFKTRVPHKTLTDSRYHCYRLASANGSPKFTQSFTFALISSKFWNYNKARTHHITKPLELTLQFEPYCSTSLGRTEVTDSNITDCNTRVVDIASYSQTKNLTLNIADFNTRKQ